MKKFLKVFAITAVLVLAFGAMSAMAADEIEVFVNEKNIEFDVAPQIIDSRTMIPFRYVANAFNAEVDYKEEGGKQIITADLPDKNLVLEIGNPVAVLTTDKGAEEIAFDVAPLIVPEGRTLVPVRLIAEAFGCNVGWNGETRQVIIIDPAVVSAALKEASPELYNDVLTFDLTKVKGTYNGEFAVSAAAGDITEENKIALTIKATDDAFALDMSYSGYDFKFIADKDALYTQEASITGDKWEKQPLADGLSAYSLEDMTLTISADMIVSALCNTMVEEYVPTADTYNKITSLMDIFVESTKDDGLVIKEDKNSKTVEYSTIFPLETTVAGVRMKKVTSGDISKEFALTIAAADLEETDISTNITFTMTRDDKIKTTKIDIPAEKDIIAE